jgi:hypothetical protein
MAVLIGSRAWDDNFEDAFLGPDWDLVMKKQDFIDFLNGEFIIDISYDSLQELKFRVKTSPKRLFEIELEEAYQSNKLLHNFEVASSLHDFGFQTRPISPMACLALKTSHITFPIKWRKNALQLTAMRAWYQTTALTDLFESNAQREQLKQLVEVRSKETLARLLAKSKPRAVDNSNLKELKSKLLDEQSFAKFAPTDTSDSIHFHTTDTFVSRSKFNSGTEEYKFEVIQKQLELIAGLYFVNHSALAQMSFEARVTEICLLSLQTFCCQQVAEISATDHHALAQRTHHIYQKYRILPIRKEHEIKNLATTLNAMNVTKLPLATDEQVSQSPLGNPVIQWLVDHWSNFTVTPSLAFREFVVNHSTDQRQTACNPALPPELMELIFSFIDEHITHCSLIRVNKFYRARYNSNDAWKRLTTKCWTEEQLSYSKLLNAPSNSKKEKRKRERLDQVQWQQVFAEIYDLALQHSFVLCGHCKGFHDSVVAHGREDRDEAHWDHCPCKDCDAGSWRACQYTEEYRWEE